MKGIVLVTGDDAFSPQVQAECARLGLAFSTAMPAERAPGWALVADLGLLSPLAAGLPNQDLTKHFFQVIALAAEGGFHARLQALRLGATGFLQRPVAVETLLSLLRGAGAEPIKVLVVDDDPIAARVTGRQLELAGMQVMAVEDPAQALDSLRDFQPDLAILDLYMPLCSGTELAQIIRQIPRFDCLPIVFLSSEGELAAQMNAVSTGGDDFVAKGTPAALMIPLIRSRAARMRALRRHLVKEIP
jgi:CheY-like chemotaxis protein